MRVADDAIYSVVRVQVLELAQTQSSSGSNLDLFRSVMYLALSQAVTGRLCAELVGRNW